MAGMGACVSRDGRRGRLRSRANDAQHHDADEEAAEAIHAATGSHGECQAFSSGKSIRKKRTAGFPAVLERCG
jgi:hypothetical protein